MIDAHASSEHLTSLVYELLDAHDDTLRIVGEAALDVEWKTHLDYLRDLQRIGRELLAAKSSSRFGT